MDDGRGRHFAHVAPRSMALYAGKNLNPRALASKVAFSAGDII
jgi:hypothetical protein